MIHIVNLEDIQINKYDSVNSSSEYPKKIS